MLILSFVTKKTRPTWQLAEKAMAQFASLLNYAMGIFVGLGFMLVGLLKTGMAASLTAWVVSLGGENLFLILMLGVAFSLIMGMVGLDKTSYLFLAVTLAPAVIELGGLPVIAVHLFLIYYGGMGGLTPPVAIHAYVAAGIAGANPTKTSYRTVRLAVVLAIFPFFFVYQPALIILNSSIGDILMYLSLAMVGLWLLTSGLEGYLMKVGRLKLWERGLFIIGGFLFAFPEWRMTIFGAIICATTLVFTLIRKRAAARLGAGS